MTHPRSGAVLAAGGGFRRHLSFTINCDGIHTVAQASLRSHVGSVTTDTRGRVCSALSYALGC
jgi:mRNA-degrading endonuclease toxin of MazEF toxin-antitoxin module